ncbi:MAG: ankyrin repeat domain-containing protein [Pseudomonadota bacterium]
MAFMDLFRPEWKHSNGAVRKAAVGKLTDQAVLAEVANDDEDWRVRKAAVEKLTDQTVLTKIAKNDKNSAVRIAAEKKLPGSAKVSLSVIKTDSSKRSVSGIPFEVAEKDEGKMSWDAAMKPRPDGWRLPTLDELHLMYQHKDEIGGFTNGYYWSSTESNVTLSWFERVSDGYQGFNFKNYSYVVRCVRDKSFNHLNIQKKNTKTDSGKSAASGIKNVNAKDSLGITPLHTAVSEGRKEVAELLISEGADVNAKRNNGITPLHLAIIKGSKEVAELLISKGADVNAKDDTGMTPLHMVAIIEGSKGVAELLISKGADVNAKDNKGSTPLSLAVICSHKEVARLLISKGADVNAKRPSMGALFGAGFLSGEE